MTLDSIRNSCDVLEDVCGKVTCTGNNPTSTYTDYDYEYEDKKLKKLTKMNRSVINIYCCSPIQRTMLNRNDPIKKLEVQPKGKAGTKELSKTKVTG